MAARLLSWRGRITVAEMFVLQILLQFAVFTLKTILAGPDDWQVRAILDGGAGLLFLLMLSKRFHDHNLSGWWALAGLPVIAYNTYRSWRFSLPDPLGAPGPWWYEQAVWVLIPLAIVLLGFAFIPGSGDNRFGPDPRVKREIEPSAA